MQSGHIHTGNPTHASLSQLNRLYYLNQYIRREYSSLSDDNYDSDQSNYTLDGSHDYNSAQSQYRIRKKARHYDSGQANYDWKQSLQVTEELYKCLKNNSKYTSTLHTPSETSGDQWIRGSNIDRDFHIEQRLSAIEKLIKQGKIKEAMPDVNEISSQGSKSHEKICNRIEYCLITQVLVLSLSDCLYALDAFLQMDFQARYLLRALILRMDKHYDSIEKTPSNIVQLLFFIGLSVKAPAELMHCLELYVEENMADFDLVELTLMCYTFCVTRPAMRESQLVHAMANRVIEEVRKGLDNRQCNVNADLIGKIFKSFNYSYYSNVKFYKELADLICGADLRLLNDTIIKDDCPALEISRACSSRGIKHKELILMIERSISGNNNILIFLVRVYMLWQSTWGN